MPPSSTERPPPRPQARFSWPVVPSGYRSIRVPRAISDSDDVAIVDGIIRADPDELPRITYPLAASTALHRALAQLEMSPEAVVDFANRWGLLWSGDDFHHWLYMDKEVEPFEQWQYAIAGLAYGVAAYNAIEDGDRDVIHRWLTGTYRPAAAIAELLDLGGVMWDPRPERGLFYRYDGKQEHPPFAASEIANWPPSRLLSAARERLLLACITPMLENFAAPAVVFDENGRGRVVVMPINLVGAAWLEFAQAVLGERHFRPCGGCPEWFEVAPDVGRADKFYCSDVCRVNAWRLRTGRRTPRRRGAPTSSS